jgi:secreted trypsin-like serine protease
MKSFSQFTQATDLTNDDLLLISQWDGVSAYETKYINANLCESVSKKEFIAMIEQTGTSAPTLTIKKDDFNDTYTTQYMGIGQYEIYGFGNTLTGDEEMTVNISSVLQDRKILISNTAADTIYIETLDNTNAYANNIIGQVSKTYIHVIQYQ